jgi:hypothetical protein
MPPRRKRAARLRRVDSAGLLDAGLAFWLPSRSVFTRFARFAAKSWGAYALFLPPYVLARAA